jgi:hypothetical protein
MIIDSGYLVTSVSRMVQIKTGKKIIRSLLNEYIVELLGATGGGDCEAIIACDSKPYVTARLVPDYKGHRKPNPVRKLVLDQLRIRPDAVYIPGLEADQVAGVVVKFHRGHRPIRLLANDTDWYMLQDDSDDIVVVDLYRDRYLVHHTNRSVCQHYQNKVPKRRQSDFIVRHPSDIVGFKHEFGDSGDKLPKHSPELAYNLRY